MQQCLCSGLARVRWQSQQLGQLLFLLQVLHKQQVDDRQQLAVQCGQVDSMYESLAAHEQKVNIKDSVKHDDLTTALTNFQHQLTLVSGSFVLLYRRDIVVGSSGVGAAEE